MFLRTHFFYKINSQLFFPQHVWNFFTQNFSAYVGSDKKPDTPRFSIVGTQCSQKFPELLQS